MAKFFDKDIFAARLRELMESHNETTYSLADYLGLTPSAISKYCNGQMVPKLLTIEALALKYNVNPLWLHGMDVDKYSAIPKARHKKIDLLGADQGFDFVRDDAPCDLAVFCNAGDLDGPKVFDGDTVYVQKTKKPENGAVVAVSLDDQYTIRQYYELDKQVLLRHFGQASNDLIISKTDAKNVVLGTVTFYKSSNLM